MHPLWKIAKFMLVFALAFSLFGCGTSETTKEENPKIEKAEKQNKEEVKEEEAKSEPETTAPSTETSPNEAVENPTTANTTEESTQPASTEPATSSQPVTTKPKQTTTTTTTNNTVNSAATAQPPAPAPAPAPAPTPTPAPAPVVEITVTISIVGPDGPIVSEKRVSFKEGATVLDVLLQVTGKNNIDYSGRGATAYVHGMYNFYEFDYGAKSGWTYKQNGNTASKSAGAVKVQDGDRITWTYVQG